MRLWTLVLLSALVVACNRQPSSRGNTLASGQQPFIRRINPPTLHEPTGESNVVEVKGGRTAYVASQPPFDKSGVVVGEGDFVAQAKQAFENVKAALAAVNANFSNVVKVEIYLTDMSHIRELRAVREDYIGRNLPAMTIVQVPRLRREDFMIEIGAIAVVPD